MTDADAIRLKLIAGLASSPSRAAGQYTAAARIEPTVTQPFDSIEAHLGSVYRYALRLTRRPDLADELTQETMLRGWRSRGKLREARAARVWLLRIATNLWTDQCRRRRVTPVPLDDEPICPRTQPAQENEDRELVQLAMAAMDELPPKQRKVIYLATCESMSHTEVATILGISEPAVKASLSLARKEMRRRLKNVYEQVCGRPTGTKA